MVVGLLTLHLQLPGCTSLKEKRSLVKPLLSRLHREFNISAAENGLNDRWQETLICCALVSNEPSHAQTTLETILQFVECRYPNLYILDHSIETI